MSVNYYNSVSLSTYGRQETAFNLTNSLYDLGDKLSKASNMHGGKSYTIVFYEDATGTVIERNKGYKKSNSIMKKMGAAAGYALKWIAGLFNSEIRNKHLAVQKWESDSLPVMFSDVKDMDTRRVKKKFKGEGADVGPELMVGCCFEFCAHICCCK